MGVLTLTAALLPPSEDLQRQLLAWLRSQMVALSPAFANATQANSTNASSYQPGPLDIAIGQVKSDVGYFAAGCSLQIISVLILAVLAVRACRWRTRLRQQCRGGRGGDSEMSVYAVTSAWAEPDRTSVGTCATDPDNGSTESSSGRSIVQGTEDASRLRGRRHVCLVVTMLLMLLLMLTAAAVSVGMLVQFWNAGNQLQARMLTDASDSSARSGGDARGTFRASTADLVGQIGSLIDDSINSANFTLISEFQANFYIIENFFNQFARNIIQQLFDLLKLQPVLTQLQLFISKIETVVSVQAQAADLSDSLVSAAAEVSFVKDKLLERCQSLCSSGGSPDCPSIMSWLSSLQVQINPKIMHLDGLTTVITFMKQNNISAVQMRKDFAATSASINQSLSTIDAEVRKLLDSVTVAISTEFRGIKNSTDPLAISLTAAASSDSVWSAVKQARTYFVAGVIIISVALLPFYVFAVLLSTGLARCICWLLSSMAMEDVEDQRVRSRLDDLNSLGLGPDRISGCDVCTVSSAALRRADARRAKLREYRQRCVCSFRQLSGSSRTYAGWTFAVSLVSALAFCVPVCAFYATGVAEVRLCRYLNTQEGRATLDANVDSLLLQQLWPGITGMLKTSIQLPIPFDFSKRPDKLLTRLYGQCDNSTVSLFTAFGLTDVINLTEFVYSPTVLKNLDYGKGMLHTALKGLTPDMVLSADLRTIGDNAQVKMLGSLIDGELTRPDLLGQLDRPLLPIDLVALVNAIDRLAAINPTSPDSVIAAHYSNQLRVYNEDTLKPLGKSLSGLSAVINASYASQTAVTTIGLLGANIADYKLAFLNPDVVTAAADRVYDATVVGYLPPLVGLLEPMKVRILARMLPCLGLLRLLQAGTGLACSDVVDSAMCVSQALLLGLLALLLATCVLLGLLIRVSGFCCVLSGRCCCCSCSGGGGGVGGGNGGSNGSR